MIMTAGPSFFSASARPSLILNRARRAVSNSSSDVDCVSKCLTNLTSGLGDLGHASQVLDLTGLSKGIIANQNANEKYLDFMCDSYLTCRTCIDQCPASQAVTILNRGLGELEYICVESLDAFKRQSACIAPVIEETESRCNNSCMAYYPILDQLAAINNQQNPNISDTPYTDVGTLAKSLLAPICMLAKCETTCIGDAVDVKCGLQAKRLLAGSLVAAVNSFNDLLTLVGAVEVVPLSCIQIGRVGYAFQM